MLIFFQHASPPASAENGGARPPRSGLTGGVSDTMPPRSCQWQRSAARHACPALQFDASVFCLITLVRLLPGQLIHQDGTCIAIEYLHSTTYGEGGLNR